MISEAAVTDWRRSHRLPGLVELSACRRLRELASQVSADQAIVELGAHQGRSTAWLLLGAQDGADAPVVSVDPWGGLPADGLYRASRADFTATMVKTGGLPMAWQATAEQAAADWGDLVRVGLLWHDAEHDAEAVARDLTAWTPHLADDAVVALHDVCNPAMGVVDGARRALGDGWSWPGELTVWAKHPDRRGLLVLRRSP